MAGNRIDVTLSVNDDSGSLRKRNQEAKELHQNLTKAAQSAERAMKPAARRQTEIGENVEYGRGRGAMGATGAEARDFANQAQGLGGLVRLYATYAANIFAVSAAFNALRQAEATTMMAEGMDRLGAASGLALGGIAKQLVMVTDGTVSLREAMEATTKATAAGLSRDQLLELGKVAKGASQALGVNMTDALSRLSRGITKLEPELLDELGLFTKTGKAAEDYARRVNKSVDSLTDFERRQAFANAVLKEGRDKFGEIAAQANPYDKLLASLTNVAQKILEIINTGLKPIVNLFAENTGLIAAAIAVVAAKIFQQAIPAITSWRDNIAKSAQSSAQAAKDLKVIFGENVVGRLTQQFNVEQLDKQLKKATTDYDNAVKRFIASDNNYKGKSSVLEALRSGQELTSKQIATLQADANKRMNEGSEANQRHAKTALEIVKARKEVISITQEQGRAEEAFYGQSKRFSEEWQRESIARQRIAKAERMQLLSGVGEKVEQKGFGAGLGAFYQEVDSSKNLGRWDKLKTKGIGTFVAISTAANIAMQAFGPLIWAIEAAVAVFFILDSVLTTNGKEVDEFKNGIDRLKESTKTATNVNDKFANSLVTTQSIIARGTALNTLTSDIENLVTTLEKADKYANWWTRFLDGFKVPFGQDLQSSFSKNISAGLEAAIKAVPEGPLRKELEKRLKNSLGTLDFNKAFAGLSQGDVITKAREVQRIVEDVQQVVNKSRILAENVRETNKATETSFLSFQNAVFRPTQVQTFLLDTAKNVTALKDAFNDSINAPAAFKDVMDDITKLEFLSPQAATEILDITNKFKELSKPIENQKTALSEAKERLKEVNKEYDKATQGSKEYWKAVGEQGRLKQLIPQLEKELADAINRSAPLMERLGKLAAEAMGREVNNRIDVILRESQLRIQQIQNATERNALAALPRQTVESITERVRLEKEGIRIETELRQIQENLINSIDLLRIEMQIRRLKEERASIQENFAFDSRTRNEMLRAQDERIAQATAKQTALQSGSVEQLKAIAEKSPDVLPLINRLQNRAVTAAQTAAKIAEIEFKGELDKIAVTSAQEIAAREARIKNIREAAMPAGLSEEQRAAEINRRIQEERTVQAEITNIRFNAEQDRTKLAEKAGASGVAAASIRLLLSQEKQRTELSASIANSAQDQKLSIDQQVAAYTDAIAKLKELQATDKAIEEAAFSAREAQLVQDRNQLSLDQQNYRLSIDQAAQIQYSIELKDAELQRDKARYAINQQLALDSIEWGKRVAAQGNVINEQLALERAGIIQRGIVATEEADREFQRRAKLAAVSRDAMAMQARVAQDIGKVFDSVTDKMTDAFMKFAETGKLSFKDLANSVISDIARIIIRAQTLQLLEGLFGSGWQGKAGGFFANLVSGITGGATGTTGSSNPAFSLAGSRLNLGTAGFGNAKGNAFAGALEKFAKGGMFTNKIVSEPTLFKFAKGTGLMGEAGPEAIMPLRRDGQGNLGVIAKPQGGNVEVVVNNYSSAQAEARETVDSRGNRKIEVVIGEIVASEIGRRNSPVQQAMTGNFMTKPSVTRR